MPENDDVVSFIMDKIPKWKNVLGVDYIAQLLNVNRRTIINYIQSGKLQTIPLPTSEKDRRKTCIHKIPKECFKNFLIECVSKFN